MNILNVIIINKNLYKRGFLILCRDGRILTCDPLLPKQGEFIIIIDNINYSDYFYIYEKYSIH